MTGTEATIVQMISDLESAPMSTVTGSGDPIRKAVKIVAGHHVTVKLIGWEGRVVIELDRSTEALTVTEAVARIAA